MKIKCLTALSFVLAFLPLSMFGQFDDLYFDATTLPATEVKIEQEFQSESQPEYVYENENDELDQYNDDYNDYTYSSRIRRFNRVPVATVNYYSPIWGLGWRDNSFDPYFDNYWYGSDPSFVFINNSWGWNRWNSWNTWNSCRSNSWNRWGWDTYGYNSWPNSGFGFGNNVFITNNYFGGYYNNNICYNNGYNGIGNGWNNNNNNNNNGGTTNPNGTYFGSRKSGSTISSTQGRAEGPRRAVASTTTTTTPKPTRRVLKDGVKVKQTSDITGEEVTGTTTPNRKAPQTARIAADEISNGEVGSETGTVKSPRITTPSVETRPTRIRTSEATNSTPRRSTATRETSSIPRRNSESTTESSRQRSNTAPSRSYEPSSSYERSTPSSSRSSSYGSSPGSNTSSSSGSSSSSGGSGRSSQRGGGL
jgi:hypothetical protein